MRTRRILVTGASRGLGLAIVQRCLADGWQVVATARSVSPELAGLVSSQPGLVRFIDCDFSSGGPAVLEFSARADLLSGYDACVFNAAVGLDGLLTLTPESSLREAVELNLVAPMLLAREVVKGMLLRNVGGSLVFVSSIAARSGFSGLSVYAATKGGLLSFSRVLGREYGPRGIRSNCVLPGFLDTSMTAALGAEQRQRLQRRTPMGRLGTAEDVTGAVAFLISDDARHVTGTEVVVDGGSTA
jgi:3-oxoacyl-[acyl-carrier protein] reductase